MVQRKVSNKLSIQSKHVKSENFLSNIDEKSKVFDMKKKMKKSKSIKISNFDQTLQLQSTPSKTTTHDSSPNYMKPTTSSQSKKELFHVSPRKTQPCSDFKNLARKFSCESKNLSKSTTSLSLSLVRTLTKTTSFKGSRICPRKSTRATCSSTLKDSKFPSYLKLNHGGNELEGTSVMRVCSYNYCSLNGHHHHNHHNLPPLKTFISSRRRVLKRVKVEALSPRSRRLKGLGEVEKKEVDVEEKVFDELPEYDEIGIDFFIDIYANEKNDAESKGEERIEKTDFLEDVEDHEDGIKSTTEDQKSEDEDQETSWSHEEMSMEDVDNNSMDDSDFEADDMEFDDEEQFYEFDNENDDDSSVYKDEENDSKSDSLSESSHDVSVTWLDDILSSYYEDINLVDGKLKEAKSEEIIYLEELHHDDNSGGNEIQEIGYPSSEVGCDRSSLTDEIFDYPMNAEENVDEKSQENKDDNINREKNSLIQPSPMGLEEQHHDDNSGSNEIQEIGYSSSEVGYDQSSLADEIFDYLMNAEENIYEKSQDNKDDNINREEKSLIQPSPTGFELCPLRPTDETLTVDLTPDEQKSPVQLFDVVEQSIKAIPDHGKSNKRASCIVGDEESTREDWKGVIRRKRCVEDEEDDEMRKLNPREPNFLPLVPEKEKEKVDLRHQMMDERKNAEEWMVDCALRQVVNKLAPARKKKVALLVEAFETVIPKYESHLRNNSGFAHTRHIQACS